MILGIAWPDAVIVIILAIASIKGYVRGFVSELGGAVALAAGLIAPWYYNGSADATLQKYAQLGPGSAHVVAMVLTGLAVYLFVLVISRVLSRGLKKLPILGLGNALGGAAIGLAKGAILLWFVLFVALYFPLSRDIRADLHQSKLAPYLTAYDKRIDGAILAAVPWFARPVLMPYTNRHKL